jgi:hypothetical protein
MASAMAQIKDPTTIHSSLAIRVRPQGLAYGPASLPERLLGPIEKEPQADLSRGSTALDSLGSAWPCCD